MGVFSGAYLVFLIIEVLAMFTGRWQLHRVACVLSSITAIVAPTTLGAVFGVLSSRPYWHGAFTPPAMVAAAMLSGTALLGIVFSCVHRFRLTGFERAATLAIPAIRLLLTIILAVTVLAVGSPTARGLSGHGPRPSRSPVGGKPPVPGARVAGVAGLGRAPTNPPSGCIFAPRCTMADARCAAEYPPYEEKHPGHWAACWHSGRVAGEVDG